MHIHANGTRLFFDVDGPKLVADGAEMVERPTVVVLHGGPGAFDHSLYKPDLAQLTDVAQVVYLDLRGHGRSAHESDAAWSLPLWADDVRAFCEALGIERPVVWGHSFGSFVAATYAGRHPEHPAGLVLQSTLARTDLDRIAEGFRRAGGDEVAGLARSFFSGDTSVFEEFLVRVAPLYGPWVPGEEEMARTIMNTELIAQGVQLLASIDLADDLGRIRCPTLVCAGELDPLTQVVDAREVAAAIGEDRARLEMLEEAGHYAFKDVPDRYWPMLREFVTEAATAPVAVG